MKRLIIPFSQIASVSRKTNERVYRFNAVSLAALTVILILLLATTVLAQGAAYVFGYAEITNLKGHRAYTWTGTPPSGEVWTAAPVGMCQNCNCSGKLIETGWVKGTALPGGDVLTQYVGYTDVDGTVINTFLPVCLANNTWYQFKVMYSQTANRWEAWRFNDVVWFQPHALGWNSGCKVAAGGENNTTQGWMDVYGWHPEYAKWGGSWTLYNYTQSLTAGGGHIAHAYDFGYRAWGP